MLPRFEVFYDGACPLCRREIAFVRRLDRKGRITCTDISAPGFDPAPLGKSRRELMDRIHGRTSRGELVEGVEVFRQVYAAVGLGLVVALTRVPPVSWLLELGYAWFAKNRLRITGRAHCTDATCELGAR